MLLLGERSQSVRVTKLYDSSYMIFYKKAKPEKTSGCQELREGRAEGRAQDF